MTERVLLKVGDFVTRLLAGELPQDLLVTAVDDKFIHCGPWKFCRETGAEVDEDLDWGPPPLMTGSYLKEVVERVNSDDNGAEQN